MTSRATAVFMAGARIAQHCGCPGIPDDQAWVESFFRALQRRTPHLERIADPGELQRELDRTRLHYNTGRGVALRTARRAGLDAAHRARVAFRRELRQDPP